MGSTLDLGGRIELLSMDPHCGDITIALYEQASNGGPAYVVHSYSARPEVHERLEMLARAMRVLAGLKPGGGRLEFPCGGTHRMAIRRTFLEACKLDPKAPVEVRPLETLEKKLNRQVVVRGLGGGLYEIALDGPADGAAARLEAIVGGMRKLAEVTPVAGDPPRFQFPCGHAHDALVGLLLPRALNVRATLRELEMAAARGTLVAPSAQK